MAAKRSSKKKRAAKGKKRRTKKNLRPAEEILLERVSKSEFLEDTELVISPSGHEKMSEVLIDFASPLIEVFPGREDAHLTFSLATLAWNASLLPKRERKRLVGEIASELFPSDREGSETTKSFVNWMIKRKEQYFRDNKRFILDFQISGSGDDVRLSVVSSLDPLDRPSGKSWLSFAGTKSDRN
jgi:hypothetical protein